MTGEVVLQMVYVASLTVIVAAAVAAVLAAALRRRSLIGPVGTTALGAVAVYALLGYEYTPRQWIVGMLAGMAVAILSATCNWRARLRRERRDDEATNEGRKG